MTKEELLTKYCTTLYRVGDYAFTDKEDAQKYLEEHLRWELRGYSHGVIHIPLAAAEGDYDFDVDTFINEMGNIAEISYDEKGWGSLSFAYYHDDPKISSEDLLEIKDWIKQYNKVVKDIKEVLDSTYVSVEYSRNPERDNDYDFIIRGTKSEVIELFNAMYNDWAWVEQESFTYSEEEIGENDFGDPEYLGIDFKGKYFEVR